MARSDLRAQRCCQSPGKGLATFDPAHIPSPSWLPNDTGHHLALLQDCNKTSLIHKPMELSQEPHCLGRRERVAFSLFGVGILPEPLKGSKLMRIAFATMALASTA